MTTLYINNESNYMDLVAHLTHIDIGPVYHGYLKTEIYTRNQARYTFDFRYSNVKIDYQDRTITVEFSGYEDRLKDLLDTITRDKSGFDPIKHLKAVLQ